MKPRRFSDSILSFLPFMAERVNDLLFISRDLNEMRMDAAIDGSGKTVRDRNFDLLRKV